MKDFTFNTNKGIKISGKIISIPNESLNSKGPKFFLILIHAFPYDSQMFLKNFKEDSEFIKKINEILENKAQLTIILPDLPGFGASDNSHSTPTSIQPYVEFLKEIFEFFNVEHCYLGGCSMGGYVVLEFLRAFSELVDGLILMDTRTEADDEMKKISRLASNQRMVNPGHAPIWDE